MLSSFNCFYNYKKKKWNLKQIKFYKIKFKKKHLQIKYKYSFRGTRFLLLVSFKMLTVI